MGQLDEAKFAAAIAGCAKCDVKAFEVSAYLDREVTVRLARSNDDGRWAHDAAKFYDGVYRVQCLGCRAMAHDSTDCPRCHRANALGDALEAKSRLAAPTLCPSCRSTELKLSTFAPAKVKAVEHQRAAPTAGALLGDTGYHVAQVACVACNWSKTLESCPLCNGPGPLRARP